MLRPLLNLTLCAGLSLVAFGQDPGAAIKNGSSSEAMGQTAANQAELVFRNIQAVNYQHRGGRTQVDFRGADLMPQVTGKAGVDSKTGRTEIDAKFENLRSANTFGLEYLTYVLWAVTPEGRARNLGEVVVKDGKGELWATTDLQAFGLILTAEPYFAVSQPSNLVVAENVVRPDTKGTEQAVNARYELLPRGMYTATNQPIRDTVYGVDKKAPLDLLEARNAIRIARTAQAERYASASFQKAEQQLNQAENYYRQKDGKSPISTAARAAAQTAEEARVMALRQQDIERAEAERRAQAEHVAAAQAQAEAEARQRQMAEAERMRAEAARQEAETMRQQALTDAQRAEAERQQAEAAMASALAQQQAAQSREEQARMSAHESEQARLKAERDREEMRARLLQQLNQVL
jgi:chemotaxis protein histidine kinase CheA